MHTHLLYTPEPSDLEILAGLLDPGIELSFGSEDDLPKGIEVLVGGRPSREHLESCPGLRSLIIPWAGLPDTTRELMRDFPKVGVYNLHHNAPQTAEMAIALMMGAAKYLLPYDKSLRKHDWSMRYAPPRAMLLDGKTVLILGFGAIGRRVGEFCHALRMGIVAVRRNPDQSSGVPYPVTLRGPDELHSMLPMANVLIVTLPLTDETRGLLGEKELKLLPRGAIIVNVGRGPIVDEKALYDELRDGHLGGAGLDVWYHYPTTPESQANTPPANYPFHELDNVVMSPHRAGAVIERESKRMEAVAEIVNAIYRGRAPHPVNLALGY